MAIHVLTTGGEYIYIADDLALFKIDTNTPFPGFFKVTCENEQIFWFNAQHVVMVGDFQFDMTTPPAQSAMHS